MKYLKFVLSTAIISASLFYSPASFSKEDFEVNQSFTAKSKDNIQAVLQVDKKVFKVLEPITMRLILKDKDKKPVEKASIVMNLDMTDMYMPKNEVTFKEIEKGTYETQALFTMKGNWQLNTIAKIKNKLEKFSFSIEVD